MASIFFEIKESLNLGISYLEIKMKDWIPLINKTGLARYSRYYVINISQRG